MKTQGLRQSMNALSCWQKVLQPFQSVGQAWLINSCTAVFGSLCLGSRKPFMESVKEEKNTNETNDVFN